MTKPVLNNIVRDVRTAANRVLCKDVSLQLYCDVVVRLRASVRVVVATVGSSLWQNSRMIFYSDE